MTSDIKKAILIVVFIIGVIGFSTIKTNMDYQISKCMKSLCKNSKGGIAFKY